jgi:hypothetical protein
VGYTDILRQSSQIAPYLLTDDSIAFAGSRQGVDYGRRSNRAREYRLVCENQHPLDGTFDFRGQAQREVRTDAARTGDAAGKYGQKA